jgi:tartrate-resistant acid phosphatase type 5
MRRTNAVNVKVEAPSKGLQTRLPSNQSSPDKRAIVLGQNVRAEQGVLRNAPGYERIVTALQNLDGPANLIWQANLLDADREVQTTPFIGTERSLFVMRRRSQELVCEIDENGNPGSRSCTCAAAFIGDSGIPGEDAGAVATLVKNRLSSQGIIVHLGDSVYAGTLDPHVADLEECVGQYYGPDFIGGYAGIYGFGPTENRFFPILGNHDWDDLGLVQYLDFYQLPKNPNERYYHFKRGPVHFINYSGYEAEEPDGVALGSTQADWLQSVLEASDCPHIILNVHFPLYTSDSAYTPGNAALQTLAPLLIEHGVIVVSGHAHNAELLQANGLNQLVAGNGGAALRAFNDPVSPYSVWGNASVHGALFMEADRETITFEWVDVDGNSLHSVEFPAAREGSGVCYIGDAAKEIFTLEIRPDYASVEIGNSWAYRAFANYVDGTVEDVTERATWTVDDSTIAAVGPNTGIAVGNSPGTAVLTAEYRGETDTATFRVLHSCLDDPTELVFVVDRSESMGAASGGSTKLENIKEGIERALDGYDEDMDFAAVVSFAGDFDTQTEDATLNPVLTNNFQQVRDALSLLVPYGSRGIASGLDSALAELTSARHVAGNKRAVVLIVDGPANVTDPDGDVSSEAAAITAAMLAASDSADDIKALDDTKLVVIGYNVHADYEEDIRNLASPGYFFSVETRDELIAVLGGLSNLMCVYDDYYYYTPPPDGGGGPGSCNWPTPDFFDFADIEVIRGCVDLAGSGPNGESNAQAWDPIPGNGFYLDMVGTSINNCVVTDPRNDTTSGKIRTTTEFSFVTGKTYKLSFYVANYTGPLRYIEASIGNSGEIVPATQYTPGLNVFELKEITFTVSSPKTGPIVFESQVIPPSMHPGTGILIWPVAGVLLDRIMLENVTDAVVMYENDFDAENPCE